VAQKFQFGEFILDQSSYRLQRGEHVLRLEKLPMELLLLLVQRHGQLVARDEIAERLWGKDVFVDLDHGINTAIRKLRVALRDDPEKPRFIETVVGRGYRFAAPVICTNGVSALQEQPPAPRMGAPPKAAAGAARTRFILPGGPVLWGGLALAVCGLLAFVLHQNRSRHSPQPGINSLAVLPLKNLSGDPAQEYFADGMTEELIGRLSNIHGLRVIARTSAMRFKDTRQSVPEIAQALHVDAVVEGSVIHEGNQVRVNVQLIRGTTGEYVWVEEYQREYRSILALQEEVAQTIARQIKVRLIPQKRETVAGTRAADPEAHENYLKGRYYFNKRTENALEKSISFFQQAIAQDPTYAPAYCGLADAYALLGYRGHILSRDALLRAKAAASKAVELDDTLADSHASLAFIAETLEWDWPQAEREYRRALELDPGNARAHHWYAGYLIYIGKFDEGIAEAKRARELDPLSLPINNALAGRLLVAGRYDEALAQLRETLAMDPDFAPAHNRLGWAYLGKGEHEQAIHEFQKAMELSGTDDPDLLLDLGFAYAMVGRQGEAKKILSKLKSQHDRGLVPSGAIAVLYGALGKPNQAFAWLEKAYKEHDPELTYIKVGPRFEPLRHDARFQQLVRRIGLPESSAPQALFRPRPFGAVAIRAGPGNHA